MDLALKYDESIIFKLRSLYSKYGYSQYKMTKFEEYDLYAKNKDFLISSEVITFTDQSGKLMALKPDVTLSIVKNSKDTEGYVEKLYYNENVYRVSKGTKAFKEIMQVGLECIGDIDGYSISEVISLAAMSLKAISDSCVLSISHLGLLSALLESADADSDIKRDIIKCIENRNEHELKKLCEEKDIDFGIIGRLISLYGSPEAVLPQLKGLCDSPEYMKAYSQLEQILRLVDDEVKSIIQIDFSVVSDTEYYNGILFKGYIDGIPESVLSGGQYGSLMKRMSKQSGAIGFAVYLDMLDPLKPLEDEFEQDIVLLYDDSTDALALREQVNKLISEGRRVSAQKSIPNKLTYCTLMKFKDGEVEIIENNA